MPSNWSLVLLTLLHHLDATNKFEQGGSPAAAYVRKPWPANPASAALLSAGIRVLHLALQLTRCLLRKRAHTCMIAANQRDKDAAGPLWIRPDADVLGLHALLQRRQIRGDSRLWVPVLACQRVRSEPQRSESADRVKTCTRSGRSCAGGNAR
jgi:hypothetical protein